MKSDVRGCSTCEPGEERFEIYPNSRKGTRVQYDFRDWDGRLFSCVADDLDAARAKRDAWQVAISQSGGVQ